MSRRSSSGRSPALSWPDVLAEELTALTGEAPPAEPASDATEGLQSLYGRAHAARLSALCLSGGGVRSATFALGVIQGLAHTGVLGAFTYLSTVSGGGYTGQGGEFFGEDVGPR